MAGKMVSGKTKPCATVEPVVARPFAGRDPESIVSAGGGERLDPATRGWAEAGFGHSFSHVRVHADRRAAESAAAIDASAYTVGRDVVFGEGQYRPNSTHGRQLLAHELAHVVQQGSQWRGTTQGPLLLESPGSSLEREARSAEVAVSRGQAPPALSSVTGRAPAVARREAAPAPRADVDNCDETMQADLRAKQQPAIQHVRDAIASLAPGWARMTPANQAVFRQFFDPAGSGDIDASFASDVRGNYQRILGVMGSLSFDCSPNSRTICGTSRGWCVDGRIMWTCRGNIYVCRDAYAASSDDFKIENIIHESTHWALLTTDRAYSNEAGFHQLRPRGSGFGRFLNLLSNIPVLGLIFKNLPGNNDTINNPDSYSGYAMQATP